MKSSSPQIEHLKLMLNLEEKRSAVQAELESLDAQLNELKQRLVSGSPVASAPKATASKPQPKAPAQPKARAARSGRGELKNQIFAALEMAGANGVKVLDIARDLGTKPANIYAWFHAALKRYPNIKKTDGGTYRISGKGATAAPAAQTSPAKAPAKVAAKAPVKTAAPAAKAAKVAGKRSTRGAVSERIVEQLKSAGSNGVTIKDLSDKLGMPYRNLQVWFATTGKKNKGIKKIRPATYQLK